MTSQAFFSYTELVDLLVKQVIFLQHQQGIHLQHIYNRKRHHTIQSDPGTTCTTAPSFYVRSRDEFELKINRRKRICSSILEVDSGLLAQDYPIWFFHLSITERTKASILFIENRSHIDGSFIISMGKTQVAIEHKDGEKFATFSETLAPGDEGNSSDGFTLPEAQFKKLLDAAPAIFYAYLTLQAHLKADEAAGQPEHKVVTDQEEPAQEHEAADL
ncbi:hypothetical protein BGX23_007730 [Mortierella sp. AD031]|nr:hypothetical protein BGX23_007730 [Mortierella sp. AD031]